MNRTFLFVGPPGSGKGEQAKRLANASGMTHIAMGSLIRHYCDVPRPGNVCAIIEKNYKAGIPQSDVTALEILNEFLGTIDTSKGIIFDAFPLSMGEVEKLPDILSSYSLGDPVVIHIDIEEDTAVQRISTRKMCSVCGMTCMPGTTSYEKDICEMCGKPLIQREDDREEIVRFRYKEYDQRIMTLLEFYRKLGYPIVSYQSSVDEGPDEVFSAITDKLRDIGIAL